ncbi:hypothetical protein MPDQ_006659, partial [Monascus purpureus]
MAQSHSTLENSQFPSHEDSQFVHQISITSHLQKSIPESSDSMVVVTIFVGKGEDFPLAALACFHEIVV